MEVIPVGHAGAPRLAIQSTSGRLRTARNAALRNGTSIEDAACIPATMTIPQARMTVRRAGERGVLESDMESGLA